MKNGDIYKFWDGLVRKITSIKNGKIYYNRYDSKGKSIRLICSISIFWNLYKWRKYSKIK